MDPWKIQENVQGALDLNLRESHRVQVEMIEHQKKGSPSKFLLPWEMTVDKQRSLEEERGQFECMNLFQE